MTRIADRIGPTPVAGGGFLPLVASGVSGLLLDTGGAPSITAMLLVLGMTITVSVLTQNPTIPHWGRGRLKWI